MTDHDEMDDKWILLALYYPYKNIYRRMLKLPHPCILVIDSNLGLPLSIPTMEDGSPRMYGKVVGAHHVESVLLSIIPYTCYPGWRLGAEVPHVGCILQYIDKLLIHILPQVKYELLMPSPTIRARICGSCGISSEYLYSWVVE